MIGRSELHMHAATEHFLQPPLTALVTERKIDS